MSYQDHLAGVSLPEEEWRSAPGLEKFYLVSSLGRVFSIPYESAMPYGGVKTCGGHILGTTGRGGRVKFQFRGKNYKISRLVCCAFNGPPPFPGAVVMHDDEDDRNNRASNLVWGTQKQNLNYPGFLEYCRSRTGDDSPIAKAKKKLEVGS